MINHSNHSNHSNDLDNQPVDQVNLLPGAKAESTSQPVQLTADFYEPLRFEWSETDYLVACMIKEIVQRFEADYE
jgi:hypothetical protein